MIYLFKTHFSFRKSIIQVKPYKEGLTNNLVNLCIENNIKQCFVVDDNIGSIQPAFHTLNEKGINLVFGLRLNFVNDASDMSDNSNNSSHKNIIFCSDRKSYETLIQISSEANTTFMKKEPRIDYNFLHSVWCDELALAVPFYDSFLFQNMFTRNSAIPNYRDIKPTLFIENHNLPYDYYLQKSVNNFALENNLEVIETNSVYYPYRTDFQAWKVNKIIGKSDFSGRTSIVKPNLNHCGSNTFCIL